MRLLLDTHTIVWFWLDDPQLSSNARQVIGDPNNRVLVSPAILPIEIHHTAALIPMPFHHRDPFDRLIIAQAGAERIRLSAPTRFLTHTA